MTAQIIATSEEQAKELKKSNPYAKVIYRDPGSRQLIQRTNDNIGVTSTKTPVEGLKTESKGINTPVKSSPETPQNKPQDTTQGYYLGKLDEKGEISNIEFFYRNQPMKPGTGTQQGKVNIGGENIALKELGLTIIPPTERVNYYTGERTPIKQDMLGKYKSEPGLTDYEKAVKEAEKKSEEELKSYQGFRADLKRIIPKGGATISLLTSKDKKAELNKDTGNRFLSELPAAALDIPAGMGLSAFKGLRNIELTTKAIITPTSTGEGGFSKISYENVEAETSLGIMPGSTPGRAYRQVIEETPGELKQAYTDFSTPEATATSLVNIGATVFALKGLKGKGSFAESIRTAKHEKFFSISKNSYELDTSYNFLAESTKPGKTITVEILNPEMKKQPVLSIAKEESFSNLPQTTATETVIDGIQTQPTGLKTSSLKPQIQTQIYKTGEVKLDVTPERVSYVIDEPTNTISFNIIPEEFKITRFQPIENTLVFPEGSPFIGKAYIPKPTQKQIFEAIGEQPGQKSILDLQRTIKNKQGETIAIEGTPFKLESPQKQSFFLTKDTAQTTLKGNYRFIDKVEYDILEAIDKGEKIIVNVGDILGTETINIYTGVRQGFKGLFKKKEKNIFTEAENLREGQLKEGSVLTPEKPAFPTTMNINTIKEIPIIEVKPSETLKFYEITKPETDNLLDIGLKSQQGTRSEGIQITESLTDTSQRTKTLTATKLKTDLLTEQISITESRNDLISRTITRSKNKEFRTEITAKEQGIKPFLLTPFSKDLPQSDNLKGFNVLVKRKGFFEKINFSPLSKQEALAFGGFEVETTPAATFKIEKANEMIGQRFKGFFKRENFYQKNGLYIEKKKKRINTIGELRGITFKGLTKLKFGGKRR